MLYILEAVDIIVILVMLFMLAVVIRQQPSKAGIAFLLYDIFTMVFVIGIHLELMHSNTIEEALSGLCVQYVGQAGLLMALLWFISEFAHFKIPKWVYILQVIINFFVVSGIFTAKNHTYFYASMKIRTDGLYPRIEVTPGILWYLHFCVHIAAVMITILTLCMIRYRESTPIQKKRISYIAVGISILSLGLVFKCTGFFGSYNPMVCFMTVNMFCMMMAMVRYGYFGSLHAAVDNAFNHGNEGLIVIDKDHIIIFINHRMNGLFPNINEGDNIDSQKEIKEILQGKNNHMICRNGITYELRTEDIVEHGEQNGRMLWFIDQTENLQIMQQLRKADEAKTQFLMRVSHELRTPMNTMLGMNEMIIRETTEKQIKNYAENVAFAGKNMLFLIDEVLDISRLENKTLEIKQRIYSLTEVLLKAEALTRPQAENKGLSFELKMKKEWKKDKPVFLYGDDIRILQIITNLLSNAMKYTDHGQILLKAKKEHREEKPYLCLSISDTGIGIKPEEQEKIFESFERGMNAKNSQKDGIGLGLAIVKQLVNKMDGTVMVKSRLGFGSTFFVTIPWLEATEKEIEDFQNLQEEKAEEITKNSSVLPDFSTKTILAVDDNEHNLMVLTFLLRRTGVTVETVTDGNLAIEACKEKTYDLILLDHMMPVLDGIETLHKIREDKEGKNHNVKVIALTANAMHGAKQKYLSEGFADYITKPIEPKKLEELLRKYLFLDFMECDFVNKEKEKEKEQSNIMTELLEYDMQFLEAQGIDTRLGLQYADEDKEFYNQLLELFAKEKETKKQKLEEALLKTEEGSWELFITRSHGLKGEAKGIGAMQLGQLFYQLELAGKGKNSENIKALYPMVIKEWDRIAEVIRKRKQ